MTNFEHSRREASITFNAPDEPLDLTREVAIALAQIIRQYAEREDILAIDAPTEHDASQFRGCGDGSEPTTL